MIVIFRNIVVLMILIFLFGGCGSKRVFYTVDANKGKTMFKIWDTQQEDEIYQIYENQNNLYKIVYNQWTKSYTISGITKKYTEVNFKTKEEILKKYNLKKVDITSKNGYGVGRSTFEKYYINIFLDNDKKSDRYFIEYTKDEKTHIQKKMLMLKSQQIAKSKPIKFNFKSRKIPFINSEITNVEHTQNITKITVKGNNKYQSVHTGGKYALKLNGKVFQYFIINDKKYNFTHEKDNRIKYGNGEVIFIFDRVKTAKFDLTSCDSTKSNCWNVFNINSGLSIPNNQNSEYLNLPSYSDAIVGANFKKDAHFYGKKIWQDQSINAKYDYMNYTDAKNYCKSLDLLGIKEWVLPTREDFELLFRDKNYQAKRFKYVYKNSAYSARYFTSEEGCYEPKGWASEIIKDECVWAISPYYMNQYLDDIIEGKDDQSIIDKKINTLSVSSKMRKRYKNSIRCVLNPNIYNLFQQKKQTRYTDEGGIDGYLKAFASTGDKSSFNKAQNLAKTSKDKAKVEETLYNYIGGLKIFDIKANGKIITKDLESSEHDAFLLKSISNNKNLKQRFSVSLKQNSPLKLKYNSYKVKIKFRLELGYCMTINMWGPQTQCNAKNKYQEVVFNLTKSNNYAMSKTIDFGAVRQGGRSSVLLFSIDENLRWADIYYDVESTEIKSNYE